MTIMGVTNHMGWEIFPRALVSSRFGGWLITASHHQRHHDLYRCNYGLYFRHWDHLCGTGPNPGPNPGQSGEQRKPEQAATPHPATIPRSVRHQRSQWRKYRP